MDWRVTGQEILRRSERSDSARRSVRAAIARDPKGTISRNEAATHRRDYRIAGRDGGDQGLELFEKADETERLALHWGMCMVAYPFFTMVAESTGRLLRLQGTVVQAQVLRRIWDQIGERETVTRAAQRVLRSFADWAVLDYVEEPGIYKARQASAIFDPNLAAWMIEAILLSGEQKYLPLHTLRTSHSIFSFSLQSVSTRLIGKQRRLEIVRQGLDEELVGIR
jgi:hypothetical protein